MLVGYKTAARNGLLLKFREERNMTQATAAHLAGVPFQAWNRLECLDLRRVTKKNVEAIAEFLDCHVTEICPDLLKLAPELKTRHTHYRNVDVSKLLEYQRDRLVLPSPDVAASKELDMKPKLAEAMATLNERERFIVSQRYGLGGDRPKTLMEIGKQVKLTRERVRSIEAAAIRKLMGSGLSEEMFFG